MLLEILLNRLGHEFDGPTRESLIQEFLGTICKRIDNQVKAVDGIVLDIHTDRAMDTLTKVRVLQTRLEKLVTDIDPRFYK